MARVFSRRRHCGHGRLGRHAREGTSRGTRGPRIAGESNVVFSVDLFNEGVDVPSVDTLLLLRPTDSPTLFLQQLGRGLRRSAWQDVLHRPRLRQDTIARSSASIDAWGRCSAGSRKDLTSRVEGGFPFLPAGCHMELDRVATGDRAAQAFALRCHQRWTAKVEALRRLADRTTERFARRLPERDRLRPRRHLRRQPIVVGPVRRCRPRRGTARPQEKSLRRACGRLLHVDDDVAHSTRIDIP